MSRVAIPGGTLETRVDGPGGDAPWLVLCNGIATDHRVWDAQIPAFAAAYRVLRYDTRGHGGSSAPAGAYDFAMLVDDVIAVLDHHGVARASLLGLSLGGMTGLGVALRYPERLTALVCCNARADAPPPFVKSWDDRIAAIAAGGTAAIVPGTLERWLGPATREADPGLVARLGEMILRTSPAGFAGCAAALKQLDFLRELGGIKTPTLYVAGENDAGAPVEAMRAMAAATPGAKLAIVPQAAHISNLDNPAGFLDAVGPFLGLNRAAAEAQRC